MDTSAWYTRKKNLIMDWVSIRFLLPKAKIVEQGLFHKWVLLTLLCPKAISICTCKHWKPLGDQPTPCWLQSYAHQIVWLWIIPYFLYIDWNDVIQNGRRDFITSCYTASIASLPTCFHSTKNSSRFEYKFQNKIFITLECEGKI